MDDRVPVEVPENPEPLSPQVERFRESVNELKREIIGAATESGSQSIEKFNEAGKRVGEMGIKLKEILKQTDQEEDRNTPIQAGGTFDELRRYFEGNGVIFEELTPDERRECLRILKIDTIDFPYDLSPPHTNSVLKGRKAQYER